MILPVSPAAKPNAMVGHPSRCTIRETLMPLPAGSICVSRTRWMVPGSSRSTQEVWSTAGLGVNVMIMPVFFVTLPELKTRGEKDYLLMPRFAPGLPGVCTLPGCYPVGCVRAARFAVEAELQPPAHKRRWRGALLRARRSAHPFRHHRSWPVDQASCDELPPQSILARPSPQHGIVLFEVRLQIAL